MDSVEVQMPLAQPTTIKAYWAGENGERIWVEIPAVTYYFDDLLPFAEEIS